MAKTKAKQKRLTPQTSSAGETRERLLLAGRQLFFEKGYDHTSLRDIADKAAANQAAVYYHFGTKEALFTKLIEEFCSRDNDNFSRLLSAATSAAEIPVRLEIFFEGIILFHHQNADILIAISKCPLQYLEPVRVLFDTHVKRIHKISLQFLTDAQERGFLRAEVNLKIANHALISTILHPIHAPRAGELFPELNIKKESTRKEFVRSFIDLTLHGILNR